MATEIMTGSLAAVDLSLLTTDPSTTPDVVNYG
jgi:hypothetical protein